MADVELKPCPFCGEDAISRKTVWGCWAECNSCYAAVGYCGMDDIYPYGEFDTEEEAIDAWNRRA